jgi:hypothetical protein
MAHQSTTTHTLQAYTYDEDLAPTLYVEGNISTSGEKPIVSLHEKEPQGSNPEELLMGMKPDVYNPEGEGTLTVQKFEKKLRSLDDYTTVMILAKKGNINLKVKKRNRKP